MRANQEGEEFVLRTGAEQSRLVAAVCDRRGQHIIS